MLDSADTTLHSALALESAGTERTAAGRCVVSGAGEGVDSRPNAMAAVGYVSESEGLAAAAAA